MTLVVSTPASSLPFEVSEAKTHLRVTHSNDDSYIEMLIKTAVKRCEWFTGKQIMPATWELYLDKFPDDEEITIHKSPVTAINSVTYTDEDGQSQTFSSDNYETDLKSDPVRIRPVEDVDWPDTDEIYNAVVIQFVAGYADAASVPDDLKAAMKLILTRLYSTRMDSNMKANYIKASETLMRPYKINRDD